jgi:hypothetical protein
MKEILAKRNKTLKCIQELKEQQTLSNRFGGPMEDSSLLLNCRPHRQILLIQHDGFNAAHMNMQTSVFHLFSEAARSEERLTE